MELLTPGEGDKLERRVAVGEGVEEVEHPGVALGIDVSLFVAAESTHRVGDRRNSLAGDATMKGTLV